MKKVAVVAHGLSGGGAERVASMVANHYSSIGHDVLYIAIYSEKKEYYLDKKIRYRFVDVQEKKKMSAFLYRGFAIKKLVKDFKADVVISFITHELFLVALSNIPLISSLRNDPQIIEGSFWLRNIRNFIYRCSKKIVFQTQGAKNHFNSKIQQKGVVIRNPFKDNLPYWSEENHRKVFIAACRISTQKNIPMMIKAFSIFYKSHPEYRLEIYGDGSSVYRNKLEEFAQKLGVGESVIFMGWSTEIHQKMCESEAYLQTSDFEGLSNSMLEAMAIGIPCICTDSSPGGAREMMGKNNAGILVPVRDYKTFAQAMSSVADNKEYRIRLSQNEKYIRQELQSEKIYEQWDALLD